VSSRLLWILVAVVGVALVATPASALVRTSGSTADPGLSEYIGQVVRVRAGSSFVTPPRYVDGVRTSGGLVLLWAGRRDDGTQCSGIAAAFGDPDIVRMKLAGRTIADNGISCGGGPLPLGVGNAGLSQGQGLGGVRVEYGQVPTRVHAVRVTFEDGHTHSAIANRGWVIVAFEPSDRRAGHRPILEQALDAHERPIATKRLNPWEYGGTEPPLPRLDGQGSTLLASVRTSSGVAQLRLSAAGHGWQRQQCWGAIIARRSTPILCSYPASFDPATPPPSTNNLFLYGPELPGMVVAIATRADQAWLVAADHSVAPGLVVRLTLAGSRQTIIVAATRRGRSALRGIVTSRGGRVVGALLMASHQRNSTSTAPCFLAAPSAGAPAATPACRALMAIAARRAGVSQG
jgi:hypothetical protein